jgi:hypothetical protein
MLKKIMRALVGAILLVASAMPVLAEWNLDQRMRIRVPFDFSASGRTMPAGEYTVNVRPDTGTIMMQAKGQTPLILTTIPKESLNVSTRGRLVFLKSGTTLSLSEIWTRGNSTGQTLPLKSETQKEAARQKAAKESLVVTIP